MTYREMLLSKNGLATLYLSREFLKVAINQKIPTVTEFSEKLDLSRGTVQNSMRFLQDNQAIELVPRGHMGTYMEKKNTRILLEFAGITSIVGVMPLPYSRKYEGFATGLISALENQYNLPASLAYMRGAKNRVSMVLAGRYDFAVVSKYAAMQFIEMGHELVIVKEFGPYSYLSEHVLVFHDNQAKGIVNGMRVGVDLDSLDQQNLTEKACLGKKVEFVPVDYSQILQHIQTGNIDAAIWNRDEITDKKMEINHIPLTLEDLRDTEAVILCLKGSDEIVSLLNEIIDIDVVLDTQRLVLEHKLTPSY